MALKMGSGAKSKPKIPLQIGQPESDMSEMFIETKRKLVQIRDKCQR